jgi:hypothetical protein
MTREESFLSQLAVIDRVIAWVCARRGLRGRRPAGEQPGGHDRNASRPVVQVRKAKEGHVRKQWLGCLVGGIVLLASSAPAWAGHPQERRGFWIGFGGGYGSAGVGCDDCDSSEREGSFTGFFKLGGTLNERVLLGVEGNGWIKEEEGATLTLGALTGTVTFYPVASSGFFLKGGVGLSYIDTEFNEGSFSAGLSKTGWGLLAGIGYDLRVGRNVSLTPCVNYHYGQPGDIDFEGDVAIGGWSQNVVSFEIGLTFH